MIKVKKTKGLIFLRKFSIHQLPYDPAIPFLGIPREMEAHVHTKTCTQMFITILL